MNAYFRSRDGQVDGPFFEGQLLDMYQSGRIVATDMLCLQGGGDWLPCDAVMEGVVRDAEEANVARPQKQKVGQRVKKRPNQIFAWVLFMLGLAGIVVSLVVFLFMPAVLAFPFIILAGGVGLVLVVCGFFLDRPAWICGECGNKVEKTSSRCPVCQAMLTK